MAFLSPNRFRRPPIETVKPVAVVKAASAGARRFSRGYPNRPVEAQAGIAGAAWPVAFSTYEALAVSADRTPISTIAVGPYFYAPAARFMFAPSVSFQRNRLAAISRYLYDNFPTVGYNVDLISEFSTPVHPESRTEDASWNKEADEYFNDWAERADFSGRFTFWELEEIASKCIDLDGDCGFAMTMEAGFPQLQMVEGWRIGVLQAFPNVDVIDGCVLDPQGRIISYILQGDAVPEVVPANNFCLLWDPDRFHSYRGYSVLKRGANDARDRQDIKGFEKKATKVGSAIAGWIEGAPIEPDVWADDSGKYGDDPANPNNPYAELGNNESESEFGTGPQPPTQQQKQLSMMELLGGDIPVLPDGQTLKLGQNMRPSQNTLEMLDCLAGEFVAGLGLPPAFSLDSKLTGPNVRAVLGKAQKKFTRRSKQICKLAKWTRLRVLADAINRKKLPPRPGWERIKPRMPAQLIIDLGDAAANDREDVQAGQMTRQERWGKRGMNWDAQVDQTEHELEYIFEKAQKLSTKHNIPLATVLSSFGIEGPAQKGAGDDDEEEEEEKD